MEIKTVSFEEPLIIKINGRKVEINCFETFEHGNIKFGINAPKNVSVDREEVHYLKKQKVRVP